LAVEHITNRAYSAPPNQVAGLNGRGGDMGEGWKDRKDRETGRQKSGRMGNLLNILGG